MTQRRYVTVDVFTDQPFGGNPLAVVLDGQGLDSAAMQAIAREFNYSETTFVLPPADPAHTANVRIFTPVEELPFAGHPNVGTAYVLAREGNDAASLLFEEAAGLVPVTILREANEVVGGELTAPQSLQLSASISAEAIAACLALTPADILTSSHQPIIASVGTAFVLAEVATRDALRRVSPSLDGFSAAFAGHASNKLYIYTRDGGRGSDLHSRMFTPMGGMREDPATGSATVTLAALLATMGPDGETVLRIEQGRDMGRPSTLITRTVKRGGAVSSAHVGGRCVTMMRGVLTGP